MPLSLEEMTRIAKACLWGMGFRPWDEEPMPNDPRPETPEERAHTRWAIREFQRVSRGKYTARYDEDAKAWKQFEITEKYRNKEERIDGRLSPDDGPTKTELFELIVSWQAGGLACPVYFEARLPDNSKKRLRKPLPHSVFTGRVFRNYFWSVENLYRFEKKQSAKAAATLAALLSKARVFAFDYTWPKDGAGDPHGSYAPDQDGRVKVVVGDVGKYPPHGTRGPHSGVPAHTLLVDRPPDNDAELLPEVMYPRWNDEPERQAARWPIFAVIRAVANTECFGYFHSQNAYDHGVQSVGLCHWILFPKPVTEWREGEPEPTPEAKAGIGPAELPAFLAYWKKRDPAEYAAHIGAMGIGPAKEWGDKGLYSGGRYACELHQHNAGTTLGRVPVEDRESYRGWHWFYRFQVLSRTNRSWQRAMCDFMRLRLYNVMTTPWREGSKIAAGLRVENGPEPTIGTLFCDELCAAMLLRMHVNLPGTVMARDTASKVLEKDLEKIFLGTRQRRALLREGGPDRQEVLWKELLKLRARYREIAKTVPYLREFPKPNSTPYIGRLPAATPKLRTDTNVVISDLIEDVGVDSFDLSPSSPGVWGVLPTLTHTSIGAGPAVDLRPVLLAYEPTMRADGSRIDWPAYVVLFSPAGGFSESCRGDDGVWSAVTPGKERIKKFCKLLLFADKGVAAEAAAWMLPIGPEDVTSIQWNGPGPAGTRALKIEAKLRTWLLDGSGPDGRVLTATFRAAAGGFAAECKVVRLNGDKTFALDEQTLSDWAEGKFALSNGTTIGSALVRALSRAAAPFEINGEVVARRLNKSDPVALYPGPGDEQLVPPPGAPVTARIFASAVRSVKPTADTHAPLGSPATSGRAEFCVMQAFCEEEISRLSVSTLAPDRWNVRVRYGVEAAEIDNLWNPVVGRVRDSLEEVQAGRKASFLPDLAQPAGPLSWWTTHFALLDRPARSRTKDDFTFEYARATTPPKVVLTPHLISAASDADGFKTAVTQPELEGEFKGLADTQERRPRCSYRLCGPARGTTPWSIAPPIPGQIPLSFGLQYTRGIAAQLRMGALDLVVGERGLPASPSSMTVAFKLSDPTAQPRLKKSKDGAYDTGAWQAKFSIGISGFAPGGQDDIPGSEYAREADPFSAVVGTSDEAYRRGGAIIIPNNGDLKKANLFGATSSCYLDIDESAIPETSHTIRVQLHRRDQSFGPEPDQTDDREDSADSVIVIDTDPFMIGKVGVAEFRSALGGALTTEIGNWTNRADVGAGWELSVGARGFDVLLPPQGVGEQMHRYVESQDVTPEAPIDFRFTPLTRVRLAEPRLGRRFTDPPWNLRRIFGYPGQEAPGIGVTRVDMELLYGMPGTITAKKLRMSEVMARVGAMAGEPAATLPWARSSAKDNAIHLDRRDLWKRVVFTTHGRLALLELWRLDQEGALLLKGPDELSLRLRESAEFASPSPAGADGTNTDEEGPGPFRGGFAWAFESANVYRSVWSDPRATTAELTDPVFSALGAWGRQRASFDSDRTTVDAHFTMGRVSGLTVERVGRISTFWNHAKHVIVYARTVAPSRQFYLDQHPLHGMPVLRKVDEYIEISESERPLPTDVRAALLQGPLQSLSFGKSKTVQIRVDSRWGTDITYPDRRHGGATRTGWKVPLWRRGARPSDVYPLPQVAFMCLGSEAGRSVPAELANPERLWFFTDTSPGLGADTDTWPTVPGVDGGVVPDQHLSDPTDGHAGGAFGPDLESRAPSEGLVPFGCGEFTFILKPVREGVNIVGGRSETPITLIPRTLTIMRGVESVAVTNGDADLPTGPVILSRLDNAGARVLAELSLDDRLPDPAAWVGELESLVDGVKEDIKVAADRLKAAIDDVPTAQKLIRQVVARTAAQFDLSWPTVLGTVKAIGDRVCTALIELLDELEKTGVELDKARLQLKSVVWRQIDGDEDGPGVSVALPSLPGLPGEALNRLDAALAALGEHFVAAEREVRDTAVSLEELADRWDDAGPAPSDLAELAGLAAEASGAAARAVRTVDAVLGEIWRPWIGGLPDDLRAELQKSGGLIFELLAKARLWRFTGEVLNKTAIEQLAGVIRDWAEGGAGGSLADLETRVVRRLNRFRDLVAEHWDLMRAVTHDVEMTLSIEDAAGSPNPAGLGSKLLSVINQAATYQLVRAGVKSANAEFQARLEDSEEFKGVPGGVRAAVVALLDDLINHGFPVTGDKIVTLSGIRGLFDNWDDELKAIRDRLKNGSLKAIHEALSEALDGLRSLADGIVGAMPRPKIPSSVDLTPLNGAVALIRAVGRTPRVPGLDFPNAIKNCGFYFLDKAGVPWPHVKLTPITAAVNQIGQALNGLEIKLPTIALGEKLLPPDLGRFDFSKLFPNFGGINLAGFFPDLRITGEPPNTVVVTHGVDPQSRSGWVRAEVSFPLTHPVNVFDVAGVRLTLRSGSMKASCRIEAAAGQAPRQISSGEIAGDWELSIGGMPIATLEGCTLTFSEAGVSFNLGAGRVKLKQAMEFLSNLLGTFSGSDGGFTVSISPTGVDLRLDLPLPNLQFGAFGICNLSLAFRAVLELVGPVGGGSPFAFSTQLALASRTAPFALNIFVLSGGGFFEFACRYHPPSYETRVCIGITAGATLALRLGPIGGAIFAYFGVIIEHTSSSARPSRLTVTATLIVGGEVALFGFITVRLVLGLEASYSSDGGMVGRGFLKLEIKICWFLTIAIEQQVETTLARGDQGGGKFGLLAAANDAAQRYFDMFDWHDAGGHP